MPLGERIKYDPVLKNGVKTVQIVRVNTSSFQKKEDQLAKEEPLEIKIVYSNKEERTTESIAITMRTPGNDKELALGFLFTESIIGSSRDIIQVRYDASELNEAATSNSILVELGSSIDLDINQLSRNFYTTSSCGVCGKTSIDLAYQHSCFQVIPNQPKLNRTLIFDLFNKLNGPEQLFSNTGGNHTVMLFDDRGQLLCFREDVGRHNAMDKVIGKALIDIEFPLSDHMMLVSGRASFELVQKASMAGIPVLLAVGAPSSLAVEMAEEYGMTLIGFLKQDKFNIYTHPERIIP